MHTVPPCDTTHDTALPSLHPRQSSQDMRWCCEIMCLLPCCIPCVWQRSGGKGAGSLPNTLSQFQTSGRPYRWHLSPLSGLRREVLCCQPRCPLVSPTVCLSVCLSPTVCSICICSDTGPYVSVCDGVFVCVCLITEEYNTSIQEKLPLIIGSAAAGLVFLIAVVVIVIVCNR